MSKRELPSVSYLRQLAVGKILHGNPYPGSRDVILTDKLGVFKNAIPKLVRQVEKAVKIEIARLNKSEKVETISVLCGIPKNRVIERVARKNLKLNREQMLIYLMSALDKFDAEGVDNPMLRSEVFRLLKK